MAVQGFIAGTALLMRRVWQLYVAHVLLFVAYAAAIGYVAQLGHSHLLDEFNVARLIVEPVATLTQGLLLKFKPLNLDVLPLYIVLMAGFAPLLMLMMRFPDAALAASITVYFFARHFGWNFFRASIRRLVFQPVRLATLVHVGRLARRSLGGSGRAYALGRSPIVLAASIAFVVFALVMTLGGSFDALAAWMPARLLEIFTPNDKTNLAPYRVLHLLALAVIVIRIVPESWTGLHFPLLRPLVICGQRSLEVFCVGIFLSFVGHFILEMYSNHPVTQIAVSVAGWMLMTCVAFYRTWSRSLDAPAARRATAVVTAPRRYDFHIEPESVR